MCVVNKKFELFEFVSPYMGGTRGSGVLSSACYVLEMSGEWCMWSV